jgi:hypothetical protein
MMSSETGFDFASQIDACGGNMWIWHRKMNAENQGLKLLKPSEKVLSISELAGNWKDHIEVVQRRRSKVRVGELTEELSKTRSSSLPTAGGSCRLMRSTRPSSTSFNTQASHACGSRTITFCKRTPAPCRS